MQKLAATLAFPLLFVGAYLGGWRGGLTGFIGTMSIGSALAIALGERGTGVAGETPMGSFQRLGGLIGAALSIVGVLYGGWRLGWAWALGGYVVGMVVTYGLAATAKRPQNEG